MKELQNKSAQRYAPKVLALSVSALMTSMIATTVAQASDIEIYQKATEGSVTLMLMLDISTSMNWDGDNPVPQRGDFGELTTAECSGSATETVNGYTRNYCEVSATRYNNLSAIKKQKVAEGCAKQANNSYRCIDRTNRMKDGLYDLLNGNTAKNIKPIASDRVVGLSTFGAKNGNRSSNVGAILVPARKLSEMVGTKTQRQILTETVQGMAGISSTPTALGYAEVMNYMMGLRPASLNGFNLSNSLAKTGSNNAERYLMPSSLSAQANLTVDEKKCNGQGIYVLTDGQPNAKTSDTQTMMQAATSSTFRCNTDSNWGCQHQAAIELVNSVNPAQLKVKTAVVGFGVVFGGVPAYDRSISQQENINALGNIDTNGKNAAYWGIVGGGGWYAGSSSTDIVDSINNFLDELSTEIPSVTTGSPAVPIDVLNPAVLQKSAYYQQLQPTPNLTHQLWLGNLKKFSISTTGRLQGKNSQNVVDAQGRLITPTYNEAGNITSAVYDLWAENVDPAVENADETTLNSRKFAAKGGVWSKLNLGESTTVANNAARKLLTNRRLVTGTTNQFGNSGSLQRVNLDYITDATYKNDPYRGHLATLLGYNLDVAAIPTTLAGLKSQPGLRQVGATMHSSPLLLTTEGNVDYQTSTKQMVSTNRKDYTLFGTTQGVLHVVNAENGVEEFAFVPNEMVENQRDAFRLNTLTTGGLKKMYYGVDGSWSTYAEYVLDGTGKLTVGSGKGTQQGVLDVYGGLRMGGRSYYALDLKNMSSPSLKFHINPADKKIYRGSVVSAEIPALGFMGQSWSKPSITWINWGGTRKRVMFVGGGYDAGGVDGDARNSSGVKGEYAGYEGAEYNQINKIGAGVYMFDAENGDLLWWTSDNVASTSDSTENIGVIGTKDTNLKYSVVSEIRTVDRNGDDLVDHIYFGDLGGQLFRVDFDNTQKVRGAVPKAPVRLLNLNAGTTGKSPRFYDMPGFSLYDHNGTNFAVISSGTGNRSAPLKNYTSGDTTVMYDGVYNIYDKDVARKDLYTTTTRTTVDLGQSHLGKITDSNRSNTTTAVAPYTSKQGWYYLYETCNQRGINGQLVTNCASDHGKQSEKVFGTPIAMNFKLYVSSFDSSKPGSSGDCGAGVRGESYASTFCMPYGQCATAIPDVPLGVGIQTIVTGPKDCEGTNCGGGGSDGGTGTGTDGKPKDFNAVSYCVANDGRSAFGSVGAFGDRVSSRICLTPQRWYEQVGKI